MTTWIDIAEKFRINNPRAALYLTWKELRDAPHSIEEARALVDAGLADMCQRHEPDRIVLCIRMRAVPDRKRMPVFSIRKLKQG